MPLITCTVHNAENCKHYISGNLCQHPIGCSFTNNIDNFVAHQPDGKDIEILELKSTIASLNKEVTALKIMLDTACTVLSMHGLADTIIDIKKT